MARFPIEGNELIIQVQRLNQDTMGLAIKLNAKLVVNTAPKTKGQSYDEQ
ncbi:MAG: hypothetical protein F6K11_13295 [Leptolyngbya sp. SIO3F4]|nr:hypothetical protein [Leptolyngbya sp. SIO3F4]